MASNKKTILKLDNVKKTYQMGSVEVHALRGISIEIKQGEFVLIMGPSGSGKSTCMNMVGCLDIPTSGSIYLDGQDISELEESDLAQIRGKKIGFIFQQFNLMPGLTALENVELPMIFQRIPKHERDEKAKKALEQVGLGDRMDHLPSELSGGQQQRVAIARALANEPEILLGDEPTGNVDTKTGKEIMNLLEKMHKEGKTIIMVTHDPNLSRFVERVIYLRDGEIVNSLYEEEIEEISKKKKKKSVKKDE